jgi:hypothetical protein
MKPKPPSHALKERDVLKSVLAYLKVHRIFHFRLNTGAFQAAYKGRQRFVRFGSLGAPDIICIHNGLCIGVEVKGPEGFQSQSQVLFEREFTKAGGKYVLARSIEQVHEALL